MIREKKFTPGPWLIDAYRTDDMFVRGRYDNQGYYHSDRRISSVKNKGVSVATTGCDIPQILDAYMNPSNKKEMEANANLISAAPDLLQACEKFMAGVEVHGDEKLKSRLQYHLFNMELAIKKAYGETK